MIRKKKEIIHAARKNLSRPGEFLNAHYDHMWMHDEKRNDYFCHFHIWLARLRSYILLVRGIK